MIIRRSLAATLFLLAFQMTAQQIPNWSAPPVWLHRSGPLNVQSDTSSPVPFIAIVPCRQYNSTGNPLLQGVNRTVTLTGAPCGVPASAVAMSVNITIFNITGATGNGVFKVDIVSPPLVAWINYPPTEVQRSNAGAVALSASNIVVQVAQGAGQIDFVVDMNGYYPFTTSTNPLTPGESFAIVGNNTGGIISGTNTSTAADSAGVRGVDGTGSPGGTFMTAGVRGESVGGFGALGISQFIGISGVLVNTVGATQAEGRLGFSTGGTNYGVYAATGDIGATGTKSFVVPDPGDPGRVIRYISLEGPEVGTYFRGRATLENREALIDVPESFRLVTEEEGLSIQVTPIGQPVSLWIKEISLGRIVVRGPRDVEFFYTVNGIRKGYADFQALSQGAEFIPTSASARLPEGLSPETKRRLIANGTYNPDGTVNLETAARMGWTKLWVDRAAAASR